MNKKALSSTALLLVSVLVAPFVRGGERVDLEKATAANGVVEIKSTRGDINVTGWDRDAVHVSGELDDLAEGLEFDVDGKLTLIRVKMPDRDLNRGDGSDLDIKVPRGSRVSVYGVSTDLRISDVSGGVDAASVSGDINVSGVAGKLYLKTVSGDVHLVDAKGQTSIKTVSGDTIARVDASELSYSGVSGNAEIELGNVDSLEVQTVNGDIDVSAGLNEHGRMELKTINGDCHLVLRGEINARVEAGTGPGGDIRNNFNDIRPEESFPSASRLAMTMGTGSGSIRAKTVNGDITFSRD